MTQNTIAQMTNFTLPLVPGYGAIEAYIIETRNSLNVMQRGNPIEYQYISESNNTEFTGDITCKIKQCNADTFSYPFEMAICKQASYVQVRIGPSIATPPLMSRSGPS